MQCLKTYNPLLCSLFIKLSKRFTILWILAFLLVTFAVPVYAATSKIGVIVFDGVLTSDVTAPIEVFGAATKKAWFSNYEVIVISSTLKKSVISEEGLNIVAEKTIYDNIDLDVLIVASSYTMDTHLSNKDLINFIKRQSKSATWMTSNCSGALLLAEAGVLDGKKATTWAGGEENLAKSYPKVNVQYDQNFVIDDGVITSNGGPVSYQAAFALLANLSSKKYANEISEYIQFSRLKSDF